MRSLQEHITETEQWIDSPAQGDDFAINIREECLLESHIIDVTGDAIVIAADDRMIHMLESYGMLVEEPMQERIRRYGAVGSNRAQGFTVAEGDIDFNRHPQTRDYGRGDDTDKVKRVPQTRLDDPWDAVSNEPDSVGTNPQPPMGDPWDYVQDSEQDFRRVLELAGILVREDEPIAAPQNANANDPLLGKAIDDTAVQPMEEGIMSDVDMDLRHIAKTERMDALVDAMRGEFGIKTQQYLQSMMDEVEHSLRQRGQGAREDMRMKLRMLMDRIQEIYAGQDISEAEYQGRKVTLNKPMANTDGKSKSKVYVKDPKTGNVRKVTFGDPNMRIKKSIPARRKSFRARHRCENPGPKTSARYWACRSW